MPLTPVQAWCVHLHQHPWSAGLGAGRSARAAGRRREPYPPCTSAAIMPWPSPARPPRRLPRGLPFRSHDRFPIRRPASRWRSSRRARPRRPRPPCGRSGCALGPGSDSPSLMRSSPAAARGVAGRRRRPISGTGPHLAFRLIYKLAIYFEKTWYICYPNDELRFPPQPRPSAAVHRHDPGARLRDISASLRITERSAHGIVTDLAEAGYVVKQKTAVATATRSRPPAGAGPAPGSDHRRNRRPSSRPARPLPDPGRAAVERDASGSRQACTPHLAGRTTDPRLPPCGAACSADFAVARDHRQPYCNRDRASPPGM